MDQSAQLLTLSLRQGALYNIFVSLTLVSFQRDSFTAQGRV